jgi:hypothetical protein
VLNLTNQVNIYFHNYLIIIIGQLSKPTNQSISVTIRSIILGPLKPGKYQLGTRSSQSESQEKVDWSRLKPQKSLWVHQQSWIPVVNRNKLEIKGFFYIFRCCMTMTKTAWSSPKTAINFIWRNSRLNSRAKIWSRKLNFCRRKIMS